MTPLRASTDRESTVSRRTVLRGALGAVAVAGLGTTATGTAAATNKADLIDSIASETEVDKETAERALEAFIDTTTKALKGGKRIGLVDFGSFEPPRAAAKGTDKKIEKGTDEKIDEANTAHEVGFTAAHELAAALDLVPGKGDDRRVEARDRNTGKKHDKKPRATWGGPEPDVVVDAERLVGEPEDTERPLAKADAKKVLDAFIDTTTKALKKGNRVSLGEFGSFSISKRSARKGRNPQTGKEIKIPAKKVVKFKPGAELSEKVK